MCGWDVDAHGMHLLGYMLVTDLRWSVREFQLHTTNVIAPVYKLVESFDTIMIRVTLTSTAC